ncbi:MAG TPA: DUF4402 domain-containing protein [Sphingomicrobium sp.]
MMLGALALGAQPAAAATTQVAQVSATVAKPLILTRVQDLDLGSITLGPGTWSNATVGISRTGALSCASANLICTGATKPAIYNVSGTNNRVVRITVPNVTMVNQANPSQTLTLVPDVVASVLLTNSGPPGTDFTVGGSITLSSTTPSGTYTGTFNVTVDY